jgi:hypothetical protein
MWIALIIILILLVLFKMNLFPSSPSTLNVRGVCFKRAGELKQIRDAIKSYMDDCSQYPISLTSLVPKYIKQDKLYALNSSVTTKEWALQGNNSIKSKHDYFAYLYFGKNINGIILSERPGIWEEDSFCKDGINVITDDLGLTIIKKDDPKRKQLEQLIQMQK